MMRKPSQTMPRLTRFATLALALAGAPALAQDADASTSAPVSTKDPLPFVEIPVYVGDVRADFGIYEGENVDVAAEKFGATHALAPPELAALKAEVTRRFISIAEAVTRNAEQSAAAEQPLFEFPVSLESGEVVPLRLYEGDNLLNAVRAFAAERDVPDEFIPHLFEQVRLRVMPQPDPEAAAAAAADPADRDAPVFDIPVTVDGETEHRLRLYRGDVLGDAVERFARSIGIEDQDLQRKILEAVAERVRDTQETQRAAESAREAAAAERATAAADRSSTNAPADADADARSGETAAYVLDISAGDATYPLRLYEGDVLRSAVEAFVARHGFDSSAVPILVEQVAERIQSDVAKTRSAESEATREGAADASASAGAGAGGEPSDPSDPAAAPSPRALVTLAVAMDDAEPDAPPMPDIVLLEGQTPDEAARAYCGDNGLDLEAVAPELAKVLADNLAKRAAAGAA